MPVQINSGSGAAGRQARYAAWNFSRQGLEHHTKSHLSRLAISMSMKNFVHPTGYVREARRRGKPLAGAELIQAPGWVGRISSSTSDVLFDDLSFLLSNAGWVPRDVTTALARFPVSLSVSIQ